MHEIIKYVRTPHLSGSKLQGDDTSDGQVPISSLKDGNLVFEEKIDGANCGISFGSDLDMILQSRGHVLLGGPRERQFDLFKSWTNRLQDALFDILGARYIMYGEWMFAKHTIFYDQLPRYFLEFDIWDKEHSIFLDTPSRHGLLAGSPVVSVPVVHQGFVKTTKELRSLVRPSVYKSDLWRPSLASAADRAGIPVEQALRETDGSDFAEGLYLKVEKEGQTIGRYKFVRSDFLQVIAESGSHWAERTILPNQLADGVDIFA